MKIRLLKDWAYNSAGDVVDVWEPTAKAWIRDGVAQPVEETESRSVRVEQAAVTYEKRKAVKP